MAGGKFYKYKAKTQKSTKSEVKTLKKKVNKMTRSIEKKHHDLSATKVAASDAPVFGLSLISEGDASTQREGLQISPTYLEIRAKVKYAADNTIGNQPVRVIIFQDRDQAGTIPTVTSVLEQADISSVYNNVNLKRFRILSDKVVFPRTTMVANNLGNPLTNTYGYYSLKKKLSGTIRYLTNSNNQSGQGKYNIYAIVLGDTVIGGLDTDLAWYSRLTYTDL